MIVTPKFLVFVLLGTIFIGISIPFQLYLEVFIIYNMVLLLLVIVDYAITPIRDTFEVERIGERRLSLLEEEMIQFRIYNKSHFVAEIEVLQELPNTFDCKEDRLVESIAPHSKKEFTLHIKPNKRGAFLLEEVYIRRKGRLGFVRKDILLKNKETYKVYPSLKNLKKYHMMLRKDYFLRGGKHVLKKKSDGREFESMREYVKGDDIRKINWLKSAKENKLMVNQYEPENNKHIYILLDTGRTMSYCVNEYTKLDLAINAALFLSDVVCYNKDQSGLLTFNTKVDAFIKPAKGDNHRNLILETLYHVEGTKATSNYEEVLFYLSKQEKRRSLICIFTDIDTLQELDYVEKALTYVSRKHHVLMLLVKDEQLDQAMNRNVKDKKDAFVKGTAYKMKSEKKKIIKALQGKGITCMECDREDIVYKAVNGYMDIKNREMI